MACYTTTTKCAGWNAAVFDYDTAKAALYAVSAKPLSPLRVQITNSLNDARQIVFAVRSLRLRGVRDKVKAYWGEAIYNEDGPPIEWRQRVIGDLFRIELQNAGVEEPDASGGLDMTKAAIDWAEALQQFEQRAPLLVEDAPDVLSQLEIENAQEESKAGLLSLPAPDLIAVERKLTILFGDCGFGEIDDIAAQALILWDLRRFIGARQQ